MEITWDIEKVRTTPHVMVRGLGATWKTADHIGIGTTLAEVEKLNGKPFKLAGFDWDYGGFVNDFAGGALAKLPGGCRLGLRFEPARGAPDAVSLKVSGDSTFSSAAPAMRAARPFVVELSIIWPKS